MPSDVAWLTKKSRASGSASESHVTTWMPRSRAFLSTLEMPPRFSTATAITSTFLVIQFSTSSFCFAASRLVGPSQINSTPSSFAASSAPARQLTKYGSPLAFGIMATTGRWVFADGAGAAVAELVRPAGASERISQMLVPATRTDPPSTAAHSTATWVFLTIVSSSAAQVGTVSTWPRFRVGWAVDVRPRPGNIH